MKKHSIHPTEHDLEPSEQTLKPSEEGLDPSEEELSPDDDDLDSSDQEPGSEEHDPESFAKLEGTAVHVRPVDGLIVRCPDTHAVLPSEGRRVILSKYWRRALAAGSVTITEVLTERE